MPHHTVFISDVEYPWSYLKYQRSFRVMAQKFVVEIPGLTSFSPGDTLEIKRDGTTVIKGKVAMGALRAEKEVKTILSSFDYRRKWQLLKGAQTAPDTEAYTHLENQLVNTSLTKGTFNTYGNITVDYGATEPARFDRRRIAEEIMFITGWEFYTNPAGVCDFKSQCGTDLSSTIRFSREEGTLRGWPEDYVETSLLKVEKVTVIGNGSGSYQAYGSAQTGGYSAGDPEKTVNRKTLVNNTLCGTAATALLADMQNTIKYGVAQVVNVNEGLAFDVFDTINIRDEKLGVEENLRVAGITVEARPNEGEITLVEVCNIAHLQTSGEILIGDVRGRVEDDFARTAQLASVAQGTALDAHAGTGVNPHSGTGVNAHSGTGVSGHSGTDVNAHGGTSNVEIGTHQHSIAGADTDTGGAHTHPLTTYSGKLVEASTTLYAASVSGGSPTTAFKAITSLGLSRNYAIGPNTGSGTTHIHHIAVGETTAGGGGHNHSQIQPNNHSVYDPNNHSVYNPNTHSTTQPSNHSTTQPSDHDVTNPNHIH